jgi:hypothetical protein
MRLFSILIFLISACIPRPVLAQVYDDFHDQSLFQGLLWGGDIGAFTINTSRQLQLNAPSSGSSSLFFTPGNIGSNWECSFWLRLNLSPSSLNFGRVYLLADESDLLLAPNALYLEFGEAGTQDAPKLFGRHNGNDSLLAEGPAGSIAAAFQLFFTFRYNNGAYTLETKTSMAASSNLWLSGQLPWLPAGPYAGLAFVYTSSNSQNFYFDDLYFGPVQEPVTSKVILTELMADPEPAQGLPNTEYIELYNTSLQAQQLHGFVLYDASGSCTLPSYWLQPGCYATLVGTGKSAGFDPSKTIEVAAFPSFNNSGEPIYLVHPLGSQSDLIYYNMNWYQDTSKQEGGFSLERSSLQDPCSASDNWRASQAPLGGTPGLPNSVLTTEPDSSAAQLLFAEVRDSNLVAFGFSEPMDSTSLAQADIVFSENLGLFSRSVLPFQQLQDGAQLILLFEQALPKSQVIDVGLSWGADCWGNQNNFHTSVIRYEEPTLGELCINEILFDPPSNGSDFVEIYNSSNKYLRLGQCSIGNGQVSYPITKPAIGPKEYLALSPDTVFLKDYYPLTIATQIATQALPYFYNDSGTCALYCNGLLLDQLSYKHTWHSSLLTDTEGVSLERLDATMPTQSAQNWFSAAQSIGFASPGRANSQQLGSKQKGALYLVNPEFSPDQDAYHDFLEIHYELPAPNMLVQATIFTTGGQIVKQLCINELFGTSGLLIWDGSTEYGSIANTGIYILEFKAFSTDPSLFFNRRLSFARCIKH